MLKVSFLVTVIRADGLALRVADGKPLSFAGMRTYESTFIHLTTHCDDLVAVRVVDRRFKSSRMSMLPCFELLLRRDR